MTDLEKIGQFFPNSTPKTGPRIVGLEGLPGVGKTTTAKALMQNDPRVLAVGELSQFSENQTIPYFFPAKNAHEAQANVRYFLNLEQKRLIKTRQQLSQPDQKIELLLVDGTFLGTLAFEVATLSQVEFNILPWAIIESLAAMPNMLLPDEIYFFDLEPEKIAERAKTDLTKSRWPIFYEPWFTKAYGDFYHQLRVLFPTKIKTLDSSQNKTQVLGQLVKSLRST